MDRKEKFGKLVLLEETDADHLGVVYRAARLGPQGLDRIVTLLRYSEVISKHPEAPERLMDQARRAARLQLPGALRVLGIGRVEQSYYASFELMEGRPLRAVIDRARRESFPFGAEKALQVGSRAAAALESLHGRKDDAGTPCFHGLVKPAHLIVSWEGDVRLTGIGTWQALRGTDLLGEDEKRYLAPEQIAGEAGDARSDVHALAQVLLEVLTGRPPEGSDPLAALDTARHVTVTGEEEPLPEPISELLRGALVPEASSRFATMRTMRKAIDTLLFSGDFAPTTFNLAFFMHTLFREDMEHESAALEEASQADYTEYLPRAEAPVSSSVSDAAPDEGATRPVDRASADPESETESESEPAPPIPTEPASGTPTEPGPVSETRSPSTGASEGDSGPDATLALPTVATSVPAATPKLTAPAEPEAERTPSPGPAETTTPAPDTVSSDPSGSGRRSRPGARRATSREGTLKFARAAGPEKSRGGLALAAGLVAAVVLGGGLGFLYFTQRGPFVAGPSTTTLSPDAAAALARVRELEARLAELEREKAAMEAEQQASEEAQAPSPSPTADAAVVAAEQARIEALRQARAARARREAEIRQLEEELRAAGQRLVDEQQATQRALEQDDLPVTFPTVSTPPPTPMPVPEVRPGDLVEPGDPEVTLPVFVSGRPAEYPPAALQIRREGTVLVDALVDETGSVAEARVLESSSPGVGFEKAALQQVQSRRYRPASKRGVPVRVRIQVRVNFRL